MGERFDKMGEGGWRRTHTKKVSPAAIATGETFIDY